MTEYRVRWEVDIEASSPIEAAEKALEMQRDHASIENVFEVTPSLGISVRIDLGWGAEDTIMRLVK